MRVRLLSLLFVSCLVGCPEPDEPPPIATPDDSTPPAGDDDGEASPWDGLSPEGFVAGVIRDAGTGDVRADEAATEFGSEPPNSANSDATGAFVLEPATWEPAQILAGGDDYIQTTVAVTEASYLGIGEPLDLITWTTEAGQQWVVDTFGMEWLEGVGIVVLDFSTPEPAHAEGLSATLGADNVGSWVFDSEDVAVSATTMVANPARPWMVFLGVPPGETTIEVTPNPGMTCTAPASVATPVDSLTIVPVFCIGE